MNITLQEYAQLKRQTESELKSVKDEILDMFDDKMFDRDIYATFDDDERQLHGVLRQIMDNLTGQLTAFDRLEGLETNKFTRLINWKKSIQDRIDNE